MSSHDCLIVGTFELRDGVTEADIINAFEPIKDRLDFGLDKEIDAGDAAIEGTSFWMNIGFNHPDGGGYHKPEIKEFAKNLGSLVKDRGFFEFHDYDTGDPDAMHEVYFVGADEKQAKLAQVEYGLAKAQEWIAPVVGEAAMDVLRKQIMAFARESVGES